MRSVSQPTQSTHADPKTLPCFTSPLLPLCSPPCCAKQWLCYAQTSEQVAKTRLLRFFSSLYGTLKRGSRAALQFYPDSTEQAVLISSCAARYVYGPTLLVEASFGCFESLRLPGCYACVLSVLLLLLKTYAGRQSTFIFRSIEIYT